MLQVARRLAPLFCVDATGWRGQVVQVGKDGGSERWRLNDYSI